MKVVPFIVMWKIKKFRRERTSALVNFISLSHLFKESNNRLKID